MKKIKEISIYLLIIVMVILIRTFIITPVRVNGTSMDPTLKNGEIMILNKIKYNKNDIKKHIRAFFNLIKFFFFS